MPRPLIPSGGNDKIYTPKGLAQQIVDYFDPKGAVLEPCRGMGAFYNSLRLKDGVIVDFCEIDEGKDFYEYNLKVDWVITNPPFSQFRKFLVKSMEVSDNVVFLSLINAWFMKARLRDMREHGFSFHSIVPLNTPPNPWPQFGIQLGAVYIKRNHNLPIVFDNSLLV